MGPAQFFGKSGQEAGCSNTAALRAADITHIGKVAVELWLVFIPQGHMPGAITYLLTGVQQFLSEVILVTV